MRPPLSQYRRESLTPAALASLLAVFPAELRSVQRAPEPCDAYAAAVLARPDDLDAAARLGQCSIRDHVMIAPDGDSTRLKFRSNWTPALRALRHAVQVDPTYSRAYRPLFTILFADNRDGCSAVDCRHGASVVRDGDSILTLPRLVSGGGGDVYDELTRETRADGRASMEEVRTLALRWAAAAPDDWRPHYYLGRALLRLGDLEAAVTQLEVAATMGTPQNRRELFWPRVEALLRTNRGRQAAQVLDEAMTAPGRDTTQQFAQQVSPVNAFIGRLRPPPVDSSPYMMKLLTQGKARRDSVIRNMANAPRPPGFAVLLAGGDSSGARRILAREDSMWPPAERKPGRIPMVSEMTWQSARMHLALADTAGAETRLGEIDRALDSYRFPQFIGLLVGDFGRPWIARGWLLQAQVATARGKPGEALQIYQRLVGLWEMADDDLQPVVTQAREEMAKLR